MRKAMYLRVPGMVTSESVHALLSAVNGFVSQDPCGFLPPHL